MQWQRSGDLRVARVAGFESEMDLEYGGPLSVGSRLDGRFLLRVVDLPADTRALLLLMAADLSGDPGSTLAGRQSAGDSPWGRLIPQWQVG